eukprot:TRINITY_DN45520_c0_g1_i1.p1 TRINITY_DN45520_c0_g1~~TRINITY_DN45520_c0_g1_i1.p1  ORF type:complete len:287 (+),score=55.37 TRINITY_DN45520_c0_g1_i1:150-1010(+)
MADPGSDSQGENRPSEAGANAPRRRARNQEVQEVVDELTIETKRVTLLAEVENQLKGKSHVSRLLFGFGIADDRKVQATVEQEFQEFLKTHEDVSGLLLYIGQAAVQLLEGPTDGLFQALDVFYKLSVGTPSDPVAKDAAAAGAPHRHAIINSIRVLHFSELHGTRTSISWTAFVHASKLHGGSSQELDESNSAELVLVVYQKFLSLCLRAQDSVSDPQAEFDFMNGVYGRMVDSMPSADDVLILLSKAGADLFFSHAEFKKVFIDPFHCVLHSELLWPIPPALSY